MNFKIVCVPRNMLGYLYICQRIFILNYFSYKMLNFWGWVQRLMFTIYIYNKFISFVFNFFSLTTFFLEKKNVHLQKYSTYNIQWIMWPFTINSPESSLTTSSLPSLSNAHIILSIKFTNTLMPTTHIFDIAHPNLILLTSQFPYLLWHQHNFLGSVYYTQCLDPHITQNKLNS